MFLLSWWHYFYLTFYLKNNTFWQRAFTRPELNRFCGWTLNSWCFIHLRDAVWTDSGQTGAEVQASFDPFLSLPSVAEPDSDHLLLQVEAFGYPGYFLGGWLTFFHEAALQSLLSSQAAGGGTREGEDELDAIQYYMACTVSLLLDTW